MTIAQKRQEKERKRTWQKVKQCKYQKYAAATGACQTDCNGREVFLTHYTETFSLVKPRLFKENLKGIISSQYDSMLTWCHVSHHLELPSGSLQ